MKKNNKILNDKTEECSLGFFHSNSLTEVITIFFGTFSFIGYLPFCPGTLASLAILLILCFAGVSNSFILISLAIVLFFIGVLVSFVLEREWGKDASKIVIDEVVGMLLSLVFLPMSFLVWGIAFLIFRIFDIVKPYPIRKIEKLKGGWGVMADDVLAGIYTAVIMNIIGRFS